MHTTDIKSNGYLPTEMVCPKKEVQKFTERDGGDRQILSEGTLPQVPQGMQKTPPSNTSDLGNTLPQVSPNPSPSSPNVPKVSSPPEAVESKACGSFPQENPSSAGTNAAGGSNVEGKTEWVWPKSLNIGDKCKYFGADQPNLKGGDLLEVINLPPSDRDAVEVLLLPDRTMTFSVKRGDLLVEGES
jgi:hypothetical protein